MKKLLLVIVALAAACERVVELVPDAAQSSPREDAGGDGGVLPDGGGPLPDGPAADGAADAL